MHSLACKSQETSASVHTDVGGLCGVLSTRVVHVGTVITSDLWDKFVLRIAAIHTGGRGRGAAASTRPYSIGSWKADGPGGGQEPASA